MITAMSPASVISSRVQLSVRSQRRSAPSRNSVLSVRRSVIRRAGEGSSPQDPAGPRGETTEQIRDVKEPNIDQSKTENIQPGNISSENAERRADIGATRPPTLFGKRPCWSAVPRTFPYDTSSQYKACIQGLYTYGVPSKFLFAEAQSFDGPAPETINGRLAMLGVTSALAAELVTGVGLREQWLKAPAPILFSFAIIAIASYIPILKGFTRYAAFVCTQS